MPAATRWLIGRDTQIDLSEPRLMGVINTTPDSFHAPSRVPDGSAALRSARLMCEQGATLLDVGAESTRPGAARVDARTQIDRIEQLLEASEDEDAFPRHVALSIDTTNARVAAHALGRGMHAINDVSAGLEDPRMFAVAAERECGLVLMHRVLPPDRDSYSDRYIAPPMAGDVVAQVGAFLLERAAAAMDAGVARERIALDPGFGFGKTVEQNLELVRRIGEIVDLGFPVVAGVSRKSFVGRVSQPDRDTTPDERLPGTLALALALVDRGVKILRVHDVAAHAQTLRTWRAAQSDGINEPESPGRRT
ncbi:MAG: dihydropteroate synthase [Phycisphaerales bacterium]